VRDTWLEVGQTLLALKDYLEYQAWYDPENDGQPNDGFLLLFAGEAVNVLHVGTPRSEEAGWLYAEVAVAFSDKETSRKGWVPENVFQFSSAP